MTLGGKAAAVLLLLLVVVADGPIAAFMMPPLLLLTKGTRAALRAPPLRGRPGLPPPPVCVVLWCVDPGRQGQERGIRDRCESAGQISTCSLIKEGQIAVTARVHINCKTQKKGKKRKHQEPQSIRLVFVSFLSVFGLSVVSSLHLTPAM